VFYMKKMQPNLGHKINTKKTDLIFYINRMSPILGSLPLKK